MAGRFRPAPWLTAVLLPAAALCAALGFWQVDRHEWKAQLIAERVARLAQPPLDGVAGHAEEALSFRRVRLRGRYDNARSFFVHREPNELRAGVQLWSPLLLESDAERGDAVLVNRGWLPHAELSEVLARPTHLVEVVGVARRLDLGDAVAPAEPLAERTEWPFFYPERHARLVQESLPYPLAPLYVVRGDEGDGSFPLGGFEQPHSRVNHVAYAVTWFVLAIAAAGLWVGTGLERGGRIRAASRAQ